MGFHRNKSQYYTMTMGDLTICSIGLRIYILLISIQSPLSVLFLPVATWLLECGTVLSTTLAARHIVFRPRHDSEADAIDGDQRLHVLLGLWCEWGATMGKRHATVVPPKLVKSVSLVEFLKTCGIVRR